MCGDDHFAIGVITWPAQVVKTAKTRHLPSFRDGCMLLFSFMKGMTRQERGEKNLPNVPSCKEKRRLIDEFAAAYREVMELQAQQIQAATDSDPDFSRFDDLIHMAKQKKDEAKYAVIAHISEHHCW